ncbi:1,2-phenylacetyl-CoA epoxidase subunit PaaC [Gilvibacter sp.]|uniref:1,2-phenylacetyl-CoA epoxidase subunit PaaC n=1 Tax=Gilvibacter sp. TaxID=2729997 RepID=UPI003F4A2BFF
MEHQSLYQYLLSLGDNALILGQRLGELCGHGPSLETDIACTNIALDLLGQTRSCFQYASKQLEGKSEDDVAFLRKENEYTNVLLVEQPNNDFAFVITRQYFFDVYHLMLMEWLSANSADETVKAIANKAVKEARYHRRFSSDWMLRLGDGTEESHQRVLAAVEALWPYTQEFFVPSEAEAWAASAGVGPDLASFKAAYYNDVEALLEQATVPIPENPYFQKGGKQGRHTEHMGYLLADLQYMQRTYPNMTW